MEIKTKQEAVVELVNKLFIYTDSQQWEKLLKEVFAEKVLFDMSSVSGNPPTQISAKAICDQWKEGFKGIEHVHHQAGNHVIEFYNEDVEAKIFCYAIAIHFKRAAKNGSTREFVGSYDLHANFTDQGWRIDRFSYRLKFLRGNSDLS